MGKKRIQWLKEQLKKYSKEHKTIELKVIYPKQKKKEEKKKK